MPCRTLRVDVVSRIGALFVNKPGLSSTRGFILDGTVTRTVGVLPDDDMEQTSQGTGNYAAHTILLAPPFMPHQGAFSTRGDHGKTVDRLIRDHGQLKAGSSDEHYTHSEEAKDTSCPAQSLQDCPVGAL